MWQGGNAPNAAKGKPNIVGTRRKSRSRQKKPFHLKRVGAEIKLLHRGSQTQAPSEPSVVAQGRLVLNDMSAKGVGIFASNPLNTGFEILISLNDPKRVDLHGRVTWCQQYNLNAAVISDGPQFKYRVGIEFVFDNADEEKIIAEFCDELCKKYLYANSAAPGEEAAAAAMAPAAPAAGSSAAADFAALAAASDGEIDPTDGAGDSDGTPQAA